VGLFSLCTKLDPTIRAYECVFIGYAINNKAYWLYDLKNQVIILSNAVDFYEEKFPFI